MDSGYVLYPALRGPFELRVRDPGDFRYFILFGYSIFLNSAKKSTQSIHSLLHKNKGNLKFSFFDLQGRHGILIWSKRAGILIIPKYHAYPRGRKMRVSDSLYFSATENVLIVPIFLPNLKILNSRRE